ncbi:MAG: ABC transporter permease [Acidobacteriota bacterium]|nr:ABC transporter permease [Acidobacteriota bacterium]
MAEAIPINRQNFRLADYAPTYGALAALVLLLAANIVFTPNFADFDNFRNILVQVAPTMLVAVGMTFVIATGGIDLSVGSIMAIASATAAVSLDYGAGAAILLALFTAAAIGAFNGFLISNFKIQPIIITLALLIAGRGIAQVISNGGQLIPFSNASFEYLGQGIITGIPFQIILLILVVALAIFVLRATIFGRYIIAVGGNEEAARLSGVRVNRTKILVYAMSGLLAGLAGLIYTARLGASDASKVGDGIELDAIAATVVGGTALTGGRATIIGTVIGALIMQIITTSFNMNGIKFSYSLVIKAAIILLAVYIQRPKIN